MRVVPPDAVRAVATPELVIDAIRAGLIAHAAGRVRQAITSHLGFYDLLNSQLAGDCHVKWGHDEGSEVFVIKVATGFYGNPRRGLPSSNGLMLVLSAQTGAPLALLDDRGLLTDARTAAAGVLAVEAGGVESIPTLGVIGTGTQAAMQSRWIARRFSVGRLLIWGRHGEAAERFAAKLRDDGADARAEQTSAAVAAAADVIITTTPSRTPLLMSEDVRDGALVVAVGADARGKRELDPALVHRAARIICDDPMQCIDQGELQDIGVDPARLMTLGEVLARPEPKARGVTVVDLTGIAAQDVAIAEACWRRLAV